MAIITDKAMKMEYTINEQNRPPVPIPQPAQPAQSNRPGILEMGSTGKTSAMARPQSERDKLNAEAHRLLEECHPPID